MDRDRTADGRRATPATPFDPALAVGGLAIVSLAPASVLLLRLFPPVLPQAYGVTWLLPAAGIGTALGLAVGMLLCAERAVRGHSWPEYLRAVALGMLGSGVAVASLRATSPSTAVGFPDQGVAAAAVLAGGTLLVAQLGSPRWRWPGLRAPYPWLLLFGLVEVALAGAVLLPPANDAWPWLMGLAAALAAASAVPSPWLPAGLLASAFVSLAASRLGSLDTLPGMVAALAAGLAYAAGRTVANPMPVVAEPDDLHPPPLPLPPGADIQGVEDEAMRLARELRGTIAELLQARRTIELQRAEIAQTATMDALTGVPTRRAILERLRIEAGEARRYQHPVALVLLDLDGFAQLNHERGMLVADEVLREVALRLRLRTRSADAIGRVGPDSFLALLPHADEAGAATFADALRRRLLSRPIETSEGEVTVSVSIGVAFMRPGMEVSDEGLLAAAEEALASARAAGGNRIAFDRLHGLIRLEERRPPAG